MRSGCNQIATHVRPVEQPNRRGSQINHATSRGGCGQSHDHNHVFKPVAAISDRRRSHTGLTQSYDGRTTSRGHDHGWVIGGLSSRTTGRATSHCALRPDDGRASLNSGTIFWLRLQLVIRSSIASKPDNPVD